MINASIVTYLTDPDELRTILGDLAESSVRTVYVVDHSPTDALRPVAEEYPKAVYEKAPNLGYGTGHNRAIRRSLAEGADYHLVVNADVKWDGDVPGALASFMDSRPQCGMVTPKVRYPNGSIQYVCRLLPRPVDLLIRRFVPIKKLQRRICDRYELREFDYDTLMNIPVLPGSFMFLRCETLRDVGIFDQRYFMYAEDMDLCRRIRSRWETIFYPGVTVYHTFARESTHNFKLMVYHAVSIVKYFNKWGWLFDSERKRANSEILRQIRSGK